MFSRIFIERPRFAIVISLIMVIAGVISLTRLPVAEYPEIAPPTLYVFAVYEGASAAVVAQTVAMPLEDEINGVEDLLYFSSNSDNSGTYTCTVTFRSGTDTDIAMVNLQNAIKRAEPQLPSEVIRNGIGIYKRGDDMLAVFTFMTDGRTMSLMELNNAVNTNIKDAVCRVNGVSSADVLAIQEYSMRLWLDPLRMSGLGITTQDIADAVGSQNIQAAAGAIGTESSNDQLNYKLNVQGRLQTAEEFGDIVLRRHPDGSAVLLRDIARVEIGADSYAGRSIYNGQDTVALGIYRAPEANALITVEGAKQVVAEWVQRLPEGVSYQLAFDPTEYIKVSLREITITLISALLLVVLITWVFLQDWRATLIPSIAIPIALIGTFPFLLALGYSINILTMFGLILVVGSLCDDAIVVVENCQALMEREGLSPKAAAIKGMGQITGAIIATTLVTIACYAPLAFYGGMVGTIYTQFAVSMCISLCLSTVVALTLSPALCSILLRKPDGKVPVVFRPFNAVLNGSRKIYSHSVKLLVRRAFLTLLFFAGVLGATAFLFDRTENTFLPPEDKGQVFCDVELPAGASLARTNAAVDEFLEKIQSVEGVRSQLMVSGWSMMSGGKENVAMGIITLDKWDERTDPEFSQDAIIARLLEIGESVADAKMVFFAPPAISGLGMTGGASFQLCSIGAVDPGALSAAAKQFEAALYAHPETLYAATTYNADTPQLYLDIDRQKAELLGVGTSSIYATLQSKLASFHINDFTLAGRNFKVKMQSDSDYRATLEDVQEIQVRNAEGGMVPLSSLGKLRYMTGPSQITRFNKMASASFTAQSRPGVTSQRLLDRIEQTELPADYHIEWTDLSYQERENEGQLIPLMALALLFAYLFLVAQYESWTIPVPVMLSVGFALLGALLGLWIAGEPLSIYAQLGMVMLIGLTAKNAILMVEFSKQEREAGKSVTEAAMNGANLRYRAVLMTAWSFLFGVFPLVIATGAGSGSRQAIGITTFSGMLLATLVGIIFTPALYAVCQRLREWIKGKFKKTSPLHR